MPALENRPELEEYLLPVVSAFNDLLVGAQSMMGTSGIQSVNIVAWLDLHGYTDEEFRTWMHRGILAASAGWLQGLSDQQKQHEADSRTKSKASQIANRR